MRDAAAGQAMHDLIAELYPIPRSITGDGVRATLDVLRRHVPLAIHEVPTGTRVFDWTVPREWNIRDAFVADARGRRVVDWLASSLHVVSGSVPVRRTMTLEELRPHLHTLPDHPDWIPYRTSYYRDDWGFCLSHRSLLALAPGSYEVCIDATLEPGHLTYGELLLAGESPSEVLVSTHVCHPALANDNLSGIAVATFLAQELAARPRRYSYRFLFVPGTIGAITWLALNESRAARIAHGLVATCLGDPGPFTYKRTRQGDREIDRAVVRVLAERGRPHEVVDFTPYGYDERQYNSPGFDLPVGALSRSSHGRYPQYHTSADDLDLVEPGALAESLDVYLDVVRILEGNQTFVNQNPKGEPQLGARGLYRAAPGEIVGPTREYALLWVLNQSDGSRSLLDIAARSNLPFALIRQAAGALEAAGLLKECPPSVTA